MLYRQPPKINQTSGSKKWREPKTFEISTIDFRDELRKHPIDQGDSNGCELHLGDTVRIKNRTYMIISWFGKIDVSRYDIPNRLGITDWKMVTKTYDDLSHPDYKIISGYITDEIYKKIKPVKQKLKTPLDEWEKYKIGESGYDLDFEADRKARNAENGVHLLIDEIRMLKIEVAGIKRVCQHD